MKAKSLNLDALVSPEIGICILIFGLILVVYGYKQTKKDFDIAKLPIVKPTTKIIFGSFFMLFGFVQVLPMLAKW